MPEDIKDEIGFRLRRLQNGEHGSDRNIKRFGEDERIEHLLKIVAEGEDGNTYRGAVAAEFSEGYGFSTSLKNEQAWGSGRRKRTSIELPTG